MVRRLVNLGRNFSTPVRRYRRVAVAFAVAVVPIATAGAQAPHIAIASPTPLIAAEEIERHAAITVRGLSEGMQAHGLVVSQIDVDNGTLDAVLNAAAGANADYVLRPFLDVRGRRVTVVASVYEVATGAFVSGSIRQGRADITFVENAREMSGELAPSVRRAHEVRLAGEPPALPETLVSLEFTGGEEGARVVLGDDLEIGTIAAGRVRAPFFPVPVGTAVDVRVEKEDHYPERFEFEVDRAEMIVELPRLRPHRRWEWSARYRPQRIFAGGAGIRYYVEPGELFAGGNAVLSLFPDFRNRTLSFYNIDLDLRAGTYLFRPVTSTIRMGASLGAGSQFTMIATPGGWRDGDLPPQLFVDPFVMPVSLFVEANLGRIAPFIELDVQYGFDHAIAFLEPGLRANLTVGVFFR